MLGGDGMPSLNIQVKDDSDPMTVSASYWVVASYNVALDLANMLRKSRVESLRDSWVVGPETKHDRLVITLFVAQGYVSGGRKVVTDALGYRRRKGLTS